MSKINSNKIISDYQAAYLAANKRPIDLIYENRWFFLISSRGNERGFRARTLKQMTLTLNLRARFLGKRKIKSIRVGLQACDAEEAFKVIKEKHPTFETNCFWLDCPQKDCKKGH